MWKIRNYRISLDIWGLCLYIAIMLPSLVWLCIPAPNDILRNGTETLALDRVSFFVQVLTVAAVCLVINRTFHQPVNHFIAMGIALSVVVYLFGWIAYYMGFVGVPVILILCISPCVAFLFQTWGKRNGLGFLLALLFLVLHTIRGILNYCI